MSFITFVYFDVLKLKNRKELKNKIISISFIHVHFNQINFKKKKKKEIMLSL